MKLMDRAGLSLIRSSQWPLRPHGDCRSRTSRRTRLLSGRTCLTLCIPALAPLARHRLRSALARTRRSGLTSRAIVLPEVVAQHHDARRRRRGSERRARDSARMAHGDVRFPGAALLRMGVVVAARHSCLRARVRCGRFSRLCRAPAIVAARGVRHLRWFPPIRSTGGVGCRSFAGALSLRVLARAQRIPHSGSTRTGSSADLGIRSRRCKLESRVADGATWIAAGIALACMEALADFGAVSVFNCNTFTTAIYRAWFGMFRSTRRCNWPAC